MLVFALGVTPVLTSSNQSKSYAEELMETKINDITAKKLGIKASDVEFSNIDNATINRIFSGIKPSFIGINSETIETRTFTRSELVAMRKMQEAVFDWHVGNISKSTAEYLIDSAMAALSGTAVAKLSAVLGIKLGGGYIVLKTLIGAIDNSSRNTMTRWLKDGRNLIQKALDTGKSKVTLKYVKISWKTSGVSIISGGIILK